MAPKSRRHLKGEAMRHLTGREKLEIRVALRVEEARLLKILEHTKQPWERAPHLERLETIQPLLEIFEQANAILLPYAHEDKSKVPKALGR